MGILSQSGRASFSERLELTLCLLSLAVWLFSLWPLGYLHIKRKGVTLF